MISKEEIQNRTKWVLLILSGLYLIDPLKWIINGIIFNEILPENTWWKLLIGIIFTVIVLLLIDMD